MTDERRSKGLCDLSNINFSDRICPLSSCQPTEGETDGGSEKKLTFKNSAKQTGIDWFAIGEL